MVKNRVAILLAEKGLRENRRISRRVAADESGLSLSSVQYWATNSIKRFDGKQIAKFCAYFDCEISDLLIKTD